jgi:DNA polymerase-3 subunit delta'
MNIVGHQKITDFLTKSIERNSISQAYLFCGPEHLGKFMVALDFAKKITGSNKEINPDIMIVSPEIEKKKGIIKTKDIKISQIREMQKSLSLSPYFGKYKVAIIDDAGRLTISAQNALLKTLEESEENVVIILVCHNLEKILPTIKSRCFIKKFGLVGDKELMEIINQGENQKEIIAWSLGRPGFAIKLAEKKELDEKKEIKKFLEKILESNLSEKFFFAEELSKNSESLSEQLDFWLFLLRKNILSEGKFLSINLEKTLGLIDRISETKEDLKETNANARLALENLFLNF